MPSRDPLRRRHQCLLPDRIALARHELLAIADFLEGAHEVDPAPVAELRWLLSDGCRSPLYDEAAHVSELYAVLHAIRSGLDRRRAA